MGKDRKPREVEEIKKPFSKAVDSLNNDDVERINYAYFSKASIGSGKASLVVLPDVLGK